MQGREGFIAGGSGHIIDDTDNGVRGGICGGVVGILLAECGGEKE